MAVIIFVDKSYFYKKSVKNTIMYATTKNNNSKNLMGGIGVDFSTPHNMIHQFEVVKMAFNKYNEWHRQVKHIILSFASDEYVSPFEGSLIAYEIAKYYGDKYQVIYGVHEDTDNLHIHFIMNTVSYIDGKIYSEASWMQAEFKAYANRILMKMTNGRVSIKQKSSGYKWEIDNFENW